MLHLCAVATLGKVRVGELARALGPWDALLAKNGVASYAAAYALLQAETLFHPYSSANVGGHASQRDTCHVCAAYALLRRETRRLLLVRCKVTKKYAN